MTSETISAAEYRNLASKPRKHKYGAKRTVVDGITFDSQREAAYYAELKLRERAGEITSVEMQKPFVLSAFLTGEVIGTYQADFTYYDIAQNRQRVIDVKGFDTSLSRWKRKHVRAQYGIDVEVVR